VRQYEAEFAKGAAIVKPTDGMGNQVQIGGIDRYLSPGQPLMIAKDGELTILVPPVDGRSYGRGVGCDIDGFTWHETLAGGDAFSLCGTWRGSMADPARIEGTITGTFEYDFNDPQLRSPVSCYAADHHFTLNLTGQSSVR
jgi:hypothetical protein